MTSRAALPDVLLLAFVLLEGTAVGGPIASGKAYVLESMAEAHKFQDGGILVSSVTDPDWVPLMKRASGIVTDYGGRTSHAAIVSRELGVAAVIGTGNATEILEDEREITLSCAEGTKGYVYDGLLDYSEEQVDLRDVPEIDTRIMLNVHRNGKGVCGVYTYEVAETKVAMVHELARERGFPLKSTMEKV